MQTTGSTKGCLSVIAIFFVILILVLILRSCFSSCVAEEQNTMSESTNYGETDSDAGFENDYDDIDDATEYLDDLLNESDDSSVEVTSFLKCPKFTAEKNTSEMVDQIASVAKSNIDYFTHSDAKKIIKKIQKANHKYYGSSKEMEKYMWYGFLLDYMYDDSDPRSELGTDLVQAIKYVYRKYETVRDDATKENWRQIDKDLAKIKY